MFGEHDDYFFPHYTAVCVVNVVHFVKNDKFNVLEECSTPIKHRPQNLRCHDETRGVRVQLNVTGEQTDALESFSKVSELLVGKGLDWASIYSSEQNDSKYKDMIILNTHVTLHYINYLVMCFWERAMAYSATTVLPADVCAATKTDSPFSK